MARRTNGQPAADKADKAVVRQEAAAATPAQSGPTPDPETGTGGQAATAGEGAPSPAEAQGDAASRLVPSLIVTGPLAGRRRAGRQFGPEPVTVAVADLTEAEIEALSSDVLLKVQTVTAPY